MISILSARQLPVGSERADVVEDLAVDDVGVPALDQLRDERDLLVDEVGGARVRGVVLDVQRRAVAPEGGGVLLGDVEAAGGGAAGDHVVPRYSRYRRNVSQKQ